jgi:alkanesulfonate monooxygenase SsuD/methylene tetrahydromethanopterin reductase-like flavin-dependent oxidoreductase (luciferase family)
MKTWPKPAQRPYPPVIVGGAWPHSARRAIRYGDGWVPNASRPTYADVTEFLPNSRNMAAAAERDLATLPITIFGASEDADRLARYRDQGIARAVVMLASAGSDTVLPILDRWAGLIRRLAR